MIEILERTYRSHGRANVQLLIKYVATHFSSYSSLFRKRFDGVEMVGNRFVRLVHPGLVLKKVSWRSCRSGLLREKHEHFLVVEER